MPCSSGSPLLVLSAHASEIFVQPAECLANQQVARNEMATNRHHLTLPRGLRPDEIEIPPRVLRRHHGIELTAEEEQRHPHARQRIDGIDLGSRRHLRKKADLDDTDAHAGLLRERHRPVYPAPTVPEEADRLT